MDRTQVCALISAVGSVVLAALAAFGLRHAKAAGEQAIEQPAAAADSARAGHSGVGTSTSTRAGVRGAPV